MPHKSPGKLDLNLLVALDALLEERNVTKAAYRLQLTQPALSASLARLRSHFDDELLTRANGRYELTPLGARLAERVSSTLAAARRLLDLQDEWDPWTSAREFSVHMSDYGMWTVAPIIVRLARLEAPRTRFRFQLHAPTVVDDVAENLRLSDGIVLPHGFLADLPHTDLWQDDWMIVAASDLDELAAGLTVADLSEASWVFTSLTPTTQTPADRQLRELGLEPRVDVVVESFLALPRFIAGTDRLGLVQRRVADVIRGIDGITLVEPPFKATPLTNALWWHPSLDDDPAHIWMRALFARAARMLSEGPSPGVSWQSRQRSDRS